MRKELAGVGLFIFSFSLVFFRVLFEDATSPARHVSGGVSEEKELDEESIAAFNKYASEVLHPHHRSSPAAGAPANLNLTTSIFTSSNPNLSSSQLQSVSVWRYFKLLTKLADLPLEHAREAISDAAFAWRELLESISKEVSSPSSKDECKFSVEWENRTSNETKRRFKKISTPCGLAVDSSVTLAGVPRGDFFRIKLVNSSTRVVAFEYLVHLSNSSSGPVIVQSKGDGAPSQTCPATRTSMKKVDGLEVCSQKSFSKTRIIADKKHARSLSSDFPFVAGLPFVATLRLGSHGFHMACNGKHITSFRYQQDQKPWLVNSVEIEGDLDVYSFMATGLPVSDDQTRLLPHMNHNLKAPPVSKRPLLVVGVFSTANNLKRRMAIRRSWMKYEDVNSGAVVVRFFIGLDKNLTVNLKLWNEASSFKDMQLLPFVDQYELITLKTLAICIFGMKIVKSRFLMKTDDDTFVRIDEILLAIKEVTPSTPFLLGLVEFSAHPNRDENSKWYISQEEWNYPYYPPWPHGAGYVISREVARHVVESYENSSLKLFKLEDVAMGIWISDYQKAGKRVEYVNHDKFFNLGCEAGYVIAHYQHPQQMLCLWQQLSGGRGPLCC